MHGEDWGRDEVRAIVADYFSMLASELAGQPYNKSWHRRRLRSSLSGRSESAIERKHQNISFVLQEARHPFIPGYKPFGHRQNLLAEVVLDTIASDHRLRELVVSDVDRPVTVPEIEDILAVLEEPPLAAPPEAEQARAWLTPRPAHADYYAREAQNRSLGSAGEELVMRFERARLLHAGREELADHIEHTSQVRGDGAGYDIRSYDPDGSKRLIEVKTTNYGNNVPFFVSRNELRVSEAEAPHYHVYRVHSFRRQPRLFVLTGAISATCELESASYTARVR